MQRDPNAHGNLALRDTPLDLLTQLALETELKRVGRGYLGWCPFHDDLERDAQRQLGTPSFYVVRDRHIPL